MVLLLPQFRQGVLQPDAQPLVGSLGRLPDALGYEGGSCLYGSLGDVAPQNAPDEHGGKNIARAVEHPRLQRRFYGIALAAAGRAHTAYVASAADARHAGHNDLRRHTGQPGRLCGGLLDVLRGPGPSRAPVPLDIADGEAGDGQSTEPSGGSAQLLHRCGGAGGQEGRGSEFVDGEARLAELARMLSGNDSETARAHASELLRLAIVAR